MKNRVIRAAALLLCMVLFACTCSVGVLADETSGESSSAAENATTGGTTAETTTNTTEQIDDLTITDPYKVFCENDSFALSFSDEGMFLKVTDKRSGKEWYSAPPGSWSATPAVNKPERLSLITVSYLDKSGNENYAYSYTKSVNKDGAKLSEIKENGKVVGARIDFDFVSECFQVPVEIRLTDKGIDFSVCYDEIAVQPFSNLGISYSVNKVSIMPFFGAGDGDTEGYLAIPDGCGALVDFQTDNGTIICDYNQVVYGRDASKAIKAVTNFKERLMLPMYGIKNGNSAVTAIVTEGEARSEIFYRVPGVKSTFTNAYFNFVYRDGDTVTAKDKSWDAKSFKIFEEYALSGDTYTVSFRFTNDEKANYTGMAEVYRNYLIDEKGMKVQATADYAPLNVELIGAIRRPVSVLGFPVNKVVALTDFEDVSDINETLIDKGVDQVLIDYQYWYEGSYDKKLPGKVKAENTLGSKKELQELTAELKASGTKIFANLDFVNLRKTGNGYQKKNDATRSIDKQPAMLFEFNPATFQAYTTETDQRKVTYMLSPIHFAEATKKGVKSLLDKEYGFTGISDSNLASTFYSDFGKKEMERLEAQTEIESALQNLASATGELMLNSANGFALPYATYVSSAPIQNSGYYTFTRTIPLYQLVIQGVVNNATTATNDEADVRYAMLKAVETGSSFKVRWLAQNMKMIDTTMYDDLMNADYNLWIVEIADMYGEVETLLRSVSDQTITAHEYLENNVTKTTFANGVTVIVNYNRYAVTVDGQEVAARSYLEGRAS